jgi:hypothetical protein
MKKTIIIYRDKNSYGDSYTVYEGKDCKGTFLSDDVEIGRYVKKGGIIVDGLED